MSIWWKIIILALVGNAALQVSINQKIQEFQSIQLRINEALLHPSPSPGEKE
jgi:hypothetical protein